MDRRDFIRKATTAGAGAAASAVLVAPLATPAIAQTHPTVNWRLTSSFPKSADVIFGASQEIADIVRNATDGKFNIQLFAAGEIVPAMQAASAVADGTVEMAHTAGYYYVGQDPAFALATAIPFGLNARMTNSWFENGGTDLFNAFLAPRGLYALPAGNSGTQMGGWFRKEIVTVDDLKGLKMRIAGLAGQVMQKVGVTPQQIPAADVYAALEKGTIDAAEFVGPYDDQKLGVVKVARYYYYPAWWEGGPAMHAYFNLEKFNALPPSYQQILKTACASANSHSLAKYDARNATALRKLVAEGAVLKPFSKEIMDTCYKAAMETFAELREQSPAFKTIFDHQQAFKKEAYLWAQIAEYSYDTYMMMQQRSGAL
jgi:TRAP-type mannitol/chloroaromatic compound transport system substrate-binding protein